MTIVITAVRCHGVGVDDRKSISRSKRIFALFMSHTARTNGRHSMLMCVTHRILHV